MVEQERLEPMRAQVQARLEVQAPLAVLRARQLHTLAVEAEPGITRQEPLGALGAVEPAGEQTAVPKPAQ